LHLGNYFTTGHTASDSVRAPAPCCPCDFISRTLSPSFLSAHLFARFNITRGRPSCRLKSLPLPLTLVTISRLAASFSLSPNWVAQSTDSPMARRTDHTSWKSWTLLLSAWNVQPVDLAIITHNTAIYVHADSPSLRICINPS
jgi:hypothetical protein